MPNINTNPLPNHGRVNMINIDDHYRMIKVITLIVHDELERVVSPLNVKKKKEFVILSIAKIVALVPFEDPSRRKFAIETTASLGMTYSGRCYTP